MRWTVTAMDIRMACVLPGAVGNVSEFCQQRGISRQTYYKWQKRFAREGEAGLADRSRRPRQCPHATAVQVEEEIVRLRKQLADNGEFNGPVTIAEHLLDAGITPPDRSTIARILARRGLVTRQPRKRPRSSYHRFEASRPNEMWQSDCTGWKLTNGRPVAIGGTLDDHSRVAVGLRAGGTASGELVWAVMLAAIERWGVPMSSLSDNGSIYTNKHRPGHDEVAFEKNLRALGCRIIASSPYHPSTCGKIERFWQTLKKWLRAHGPYDTLVDLNHELDSFLEHYNDHRRHRALHGQTPAAAFAATPPARPASRPLPAPRAVRHVTVSTAGTIAIGGLQVSVGHRCSGLPVTVIKDGDHIAIYTGNQIVRDLDADPTRRYQRLHDPACS
jgi:transposase InsO family protein